jgi:regulator of cell morphogenesis and NO signaling
LHILASVGLYKKAMENILSEPLFSIIAKWPATAAVLEKFKVDYCHLSKKTLAEVCAIQQIPAYELANAIQKVLVFKPNNNSTDLSQLSLTELINYILNNYHAYLKTHLPIILTQLEKITQKHGNQLPILSDVLFYFEMWKDEISAHLIYEESKLFPAILTFEQTNSMPENISKDYINKLINLIEKEHDHSTDLIEKIKSITQNFTPPPQSCKGVQLCFNMLGNLYNNLSEHTQIENSILIPKAIQQLNWVYQ